jgi:acyl phosphate:glycerol-3-phosphate acyltransferase
MPDLTSLTTLAALALGYLLGSIPFGLIVTKQAGTQDIRSIGSGSIGATNVLRTGRKGLAAITLLGDALKGTAAVLIAGWIWGGQAAMIAGFGAFLGHIFPIWLRFKGGKGFATFLGVLLAIWWPGLVIAGAAWLAVAFLTRYSSLASLISCAIAPLALYAGGFRFEAAAFAVMAIIAFVMHRSNIQRLMRGTESKIGQKG